VELLESLERSIEFRGFAPKDDLAIINRVFGKKHRCQIRTLYELAAVSAVPDVQSDLPPEECKTELFAGLREEITDLKRQQKTLKRSSEEREGLERQSSFVPEPARLDRLPRYSASLLRDYDRCLNQLERLQRARKGQPALPTLNVNVSA
jgi:hypothetical protein